MHLRAGRGLVEGLGFYVDRVRPMQLASTGESALGYLAPFAYLRFTLVDAASGAIVREVNSDRARAVVHPSANHPWEALGSQETVRYLEELIDKAADSAVPKLLAGP